MNLFHPSEEDSFKSDGFWNWFFEEKEYTTFSVVLTSFICVVITILAALVIGEIDSRDKIDGVLEECGMSWEEVRVEDEFCAIWFEGDKQVIGPLWLKD